MGFSQGIVQARAFLKFQLVERTFAGNGGGSFAAGSAHGIDFESDTSRAADRQCNMILL